MTYNSIKNVSFSASILLHLVLLILFLLIKISMNYTPLDFVELSFGKSGETGSSGGTGTLVEDVEESSHSDQKDQTVEKNMQVKEVELPVAHNTSNENNIKPADKDKVVTDKSKTESKDPSNSKVTSEGQGNKGVGKGGFGFDIDWGGKGTRKIYSYPLPEYPEGVSKEIDIRLKFSILPDGTVGTIVPLTKADTKLENAAIGSLRQWRFEALNPAQKQVEQGAIIVFPYRLQ